MDLIEELKWRGILKDVTSQEKFKKLIEEKSPVYIGFDGTANNLHLGSLLPLAVLKHFKNYGHKTIALVGNATGGIGDPSGKNKERDLLSMDTVAKNSEAIANIIRAISEPNIIVGNMEWWKDISAIELLIRIGKKFNVTQMLSRDVVASRLENGISYTEFSYQIMQGYDFYHLFKEHGVKIQVGGSDQWGNIVSGVEYARRNSENEDSPLVGMTTHLVMKKDGKKFGKSEGGAIWLKDNAYQLYQYLWNTPDSDVIKFLKYFTFLSKKDISSIEEEHSKEPWKRVAQKTLAKEIVSWVSGMEGYKSALNITDALFSGELQSLTDSEKKELIKSMKKITITESNIVEVMATHNIAQSKKEARMLIDNGSISLNGIKMSNKDLMFNKNNSFISESGKNFWLIKKGKRNWFCIVK